MYDDDVLCLQDTLNDLDFLPGSPYADVVVKAPQREPPKPSPQEKQLRVWSLDDENRKRRAAAKMNGSDSYGEEYLTGGSACNDHHIFNNNGEDDFLKAQHIFETEDDTLPVGSPKLSPGLSPGVNTKAIKAADFLKNSKTKKANGTSPSAASTKKGVAASPKLTNFSLTNGNGMNGSRATSPKLNRATSPKGHRTHSPKSTSSGRQSAERRSKNGSPAISSPQASPTTITNRANAKSPTSSANGTKPSSPATYEAKVSPVNVRTPLHTPETQLSPPPYASDFLKHINRLNDQSAMTEPTPVRNNDTRPPSPRRSCSTEPRETVTTSLPKLGSLQSSTAKPKAKEEEDDLGFDNTRVYGFSDLNDESIWTPSHPVKGSCGSFPKSAPPEKQVVAKAPISPVAVNARKPTEPLPPVRRATHPSSNADAQLNDARSPQPPKDAPAKKSGAFTQPPRRQTYSAKTMPSTAPPPKWVPTTVAPVTKSEVVSNAKAPPTTVAPPSPQSNRKPNPPSSNSNKNNNKNNNKNSENGTTTTTTTTFAAAATTTTTGDNNNHNKNRPVLCDLLKEDITPVMSPRAAISPRLEPVSAMSRSTSPGNRVSHHSSQSNNKASQNKGSTSSSKEFALVKPSPTSNHAASPLPPKHMGLFPPKNEIPTNSSKQSGGGGGCSSQGSNNRADINVSGVSSVATSQSKVNGQSAQRTPTAPQDVVHASPNAAKRLGLFPSKDPNFINVSSNEPLAATNVPSKSPASVEKVASPACSVQHSKATSPSTTARNSAGQLVPQQPQQSNSTVSSRQGGAGDSSTGQNGDAVRGSGKDIQQQTPSKDKEKAKAVSDFNEKIRQQQLSAEKERLASQNVLGAANAGTHRQLQLQHPPRGSPQFQHIRDDIMDTITPTTPAPLSLDKKAPQRSSQPQPQPPSQGKLKAKPKPQPQQKKHDTGAKKDHGGKTDRRNCCPSTKDPKLEDSEMRVSASLNKDFAAPPPEEIVVYNRDLRKEMEKEAKQKKQRKSQTEQSPLYSCLITPCEAGNLSAQPSTFELLED